MVKKINSKKRASKPFKMPTTEKGKAEMRVTIAKDVIAQIKAKRYIPTCGTYVELPLKDKDIDKMSNEEFQKLTTKESCQVCGIGSLFISKVSKFNNFDLENLNKENVVCYDTNDFIADQGLIHDNLKDIFPIEMLNLIENYFELGDINDIDDPNESSGTDSIFPDAYPHEVWGQNCTDEERLIKICENIIKNKGYFKPVVKILIE